MNLFKCTASIIFLFMLLTGCEKSNDDQKNISKQTSKNSDSPISQAIAEQSVDDLMSKNIANFLRQSYLKKDLRLLSDSDRKFQMYKIDLNGDGKEEYFVRFMSSYFCGTGGCTFLLLDRYAEIITTFTVMNAPIYVSNEVKGGWKTLVVNSGGKFRSLVFDGKSYPSNPSVAVESKTEPVSDWEVMFDDENLKAMTYTF